MSETLLPDFDGPRDAAPAPAPKRSRRKPTKKKTRAAPTLKPAKRVPKKRRVRRTAMPVVLSASEKVLSPAFTPEAYRLIGLIMEQQWPIRALVISVVKGLSGK